MSWGVATQNGVSVSLASIVSISCGATEFSPASLFTSGVQGAWYDPSDVLLNWRYNLLTYTQQFDNAAWTKSTATVTANATTAPDGTLTADLLTVAGFGIFQLGINYTAGASYTFSFYAAPAAGSVVNVRLNGIDSGGDVVCTVNASTGVITKTSGTSVPVLASTLASNGFYRFTITIPSTFVVTGTNKYVSFETAPLGIYVWGAQLELGSTATTYQPITDGVQDYYTYDPQPVLFQDSAGTTPVTAVEQPVGLMLDKSQGLSGSGSQLVTNGDFSSPSTTGWQASGGGSFTVVSNRLQVTGAGATGTGAAYTLATVVGMTYSVSYDVVLGTALVADSQMSLSVVAGASIGSSYQYSNVSGTLKYSFVATATTTYFQFHPRGTGNTASIDNFSVISLGMGNHASQATTASRPVLRARYNLLTYSEQFDNAGWTKSNSFIQTNLLTYSEQFDNAAWTKLNSSVTADSVTAPNGTLTADTVTSTSSVSTNTGVYKGLAYAAGHTLSIYAKANTSSIAWVSSNTGESYGVFNLATGTVIDSGNATASISAVPGYPGWYRLIVANTTVASTYFITGGKDTYTTGHPWANGTWTSGNSIYLWGAQLVQGAVPGDYQQTTSAAAAVQYLAPDGTTTADSLIEDSALGVHRIQQVATTTSGAVHTLSTYIKKNTRSWVALYASGANVGRFFNVDTGTTGGTLVGTPTTSTITAVGNGWYRCEITFTATASTTYQIYLATGDGVNTYTGDGTSGLYIWGADLRTGSSAGTYQRIAAATDYATAGFLPYLAFDGVDDVLVATPASADYLLNSVAFGAQYNALSGNGTLGSIGNSATGNSFSYINENSGTSVFNASARNDAATTVSNYVGTPDLLPHVLISIWDTGGSSIRNNSSIVTGSALTGVMTVNKFALGALGRSTNTTFGNSRIYSALFISPALTTTQSAALASWIAGKSGVTL